MRLRFKKNRKPPNNSGFIRIKVCCFSFKSEGRQSRAGVVTFALKVFRLQASSHSLLIQPKNVVLSLQMAAPVSGGREEGEAKMMGLTISISSLLRKVPGNPICRT